MIKKFVLYIFLTYFCFICELDANDDSSMRKACFYKNIELLEFGMIDEMPRYDNRSLNPDSGELLITHPVIYLFSDRNHYVRSIVKKYLYCTGSQ